MIHQPHKRRIWDQEWLVVVGIALLVTLLRLPSIEQPFDNDSGANAYHARLIVRGEPLYSTHHPIHHMPAVYHVYALAFLTFGDSVLSVKLLLIPWTIATAYLLYRVALLLADRTVGWTAVLLYALLSSHLDLWGSTGEIELFANLPRVAAAWIMMRLVARDVAAPRYAFVGLLCAAAVLFKATYLTPLAMAGLVLIVDLWQHRKRKGAWTRALARGAWVGIGFAALLLLVAGYFWSQGLLERFLLVFVLGTRYVGFQNTEATLLDVFALPFISFCVNNAAILIQALVGFYGSLRNSIRAFRQKSPHLLKMLYTPAWLLLSFVEAGASRAYYPHYYQLIIPPLTLSAALFAIEFYRLLYQGLPPARRRYAVVALALLLVVTVGVSAAKNRNYYALYVQYRLGIRPYEDFVLYGWHEYLGQEAVRVQELADYVRAHTSPTDRIYYWSSSAQVYYLADRRCAIDVIWPFYAEATGPPQRIFGEQTRYVILGESDNVARPGWLYAELDGQYVLEETIKGQEIYRRLD